MADTNASDTGLLSQLNWEDQADFCQTLYDMPKVIVDGVEVSIQERFESWAQNLPYCRYDDGGDGDTIAG